MAHHPSRRAFLTHGVCIAALSGGLTACGGGGGGPAASSSGALGATSDSAAAPKPTPARFDYGVASGDPLADRVILWTHAKVMDSTADVPLTWEVATDVTFATIVSHGNVVATAATGFTVKVDATGLAAGRGYAYRFRDASGQASPTGQTRTLPTSAATSVRFAVVSCSHFASGHFNAYEAAARSGAQYVLHLGDYIYEHSGDPSLSFNADAARMGRVTEPAHVTVTLDDYRRRYACHRGDAALQELHATMPMIAIWDDHEFANNAWVGGAENHDSATQGDWATRKAAAAQAYHEWIPIRTQGEDRLKIYRRFDFGRLLTLHMLDTRIEGRDRQYDTYGDSDGGKARYRAALASGADAAHRLMSQTQEDWLTSGIAHSTAAWQVLGNQDVMARVWYPASAWRPQLDMLRDPTPPRQEAARKAIQDYLQAKATRAVGGSEALTPEQAALLDPVANPCLPHNLDGWDGYPLQREALLKSVQASGKRLVVLSGDSHNAWFTRLTTLAGETVGHEFATASVTSPGLESYGLGDFGRALDGSMLEGKLPFSTVGRGLGVVDDVDYADMRQRGYLALTVTADEVKGEFVFVSTIQSRSYTTSVGRTVTVSASGTVTHV